MKLLVLFIFLVFGVYQVSAQNATSIPLDCGAITEGELTVDQPFLEYVISAIAGTRITLIVEPLGDGFNPFIKLLDSGRGETMRLNSGRAGENEEFLDYTIGSTNSIMQVYGATPTSTATGGLNYSIGDFYGAFTISLECTLRDGTHIAIGSLQAPTTAPVFSGNGFPGLSPVDFSNAIFLPFNIGAPNNGGIAPGFDAVFGFTVDAHANDTFALDFKRLAGNLNLGMAVLSPDNKIVFQASLVTSDTLSTQFTLPIDGTYTIGVYKIDLLPPAAPENTAFQITGTLNP